MLRLDAGDSADFRMTSHMLSLFFLVSLTCSVFCDDPTGLTVRITDKAQDVLKEIGVGFMQELRGKPFDYSFEWKLLTLIVKSLTFTSLQVNPDEVVISFQENLGLHFEIKDLEFSGWLDRELNIWKLFPLISDRTDIMGSGVSAKITVKLLQNQGRPRVEMTGCEFGANSIKLKSTSYTGTVADFLLQLFKTFLIEKICPAIEEYVLPKVNSMLNELTMTRPLYPGLDPLLDYSLSRDVLVTSHSVDVSFKGRVFRESEKTDTAGTEGAPITGTPITGTDLMAYVGASELFFNRVARSLFSAGVMKGTKPVNELPGSAPKALRFLQLFRQPTRLLEPLFVGVEVTEVPTISISKKDGVTFNVRVRVKEWSEPAGKQPKQFGSSSAKCQVKMKVSIKGQLLTSDMADSINCRIVTKNSARDILVKPLDTMMNNKLKHFLDAYFDEGLPIPFPEGIGFTETNIEYHDGFVVLGGSLYLTPVAKEKLAKELAKVLP